MECKALGAVPAEQLDAFKDRLVGLSGVDGQDVYLHELVMRSSSPDRPELHLQHSMGGPSGTGRGSGSWTVTQYRTPLDARTAAELPATVRSVARSQCLGPDVLAFWKALGFCVRYQMVKQGLQYEVEHAGHTVQVLLCQVLRLPPEGQVQGGSAGGEEVAPGHWLVEATTPVEGGAYADAAAALGSLSKLLAPHTSLKPLPTGRPRPAFG